MYIYINIYNYIYNWGFLGMGYDINHGFQYQILQCWMIWGCTHFRKPPCTVL